MDTGFLSKNSQQSSTFQRLLPALVPALLIAVGYVDPGKWATAVDGGARFGGDLVFSMFLFNVAAILCQYLSAQIAVVTGRDLSQICSEEYDKATCIFLGVLTEFSMVALDLSLILGTAHIFNLLFGVDMCTCIFLTVVEAALRHVFAAFLNDGKARFLCISVTGILLLLFVLGVLTSQPESSVSASGMLTKLSGESAFALMSLLGASVMPHNFYLHSSIVQQEVGLRNFPKGFLWYDHLFSIVCIFSGIFLVNYELMSAAANAFYSTGLSLLTFQDALPLIDQLSRSSAMPFAFLLVIFVSSQITAIAWSVGRQTLLLEFFGLDIPGWLHHITIRIFALIPALYCVWNLGAEGMYQLLICSQVFVALILPPSVIPLFRVASSKSIMGEQKISQLLEFLCLITLIGMLGLKLIFLVEMIFGDSDWVTNLRWNMGNSMSASFMILIATAFASLCLMLWLAATPLESATMRLDTQTWDWDLKEDPSVLTTEKEDSDRIELVQKQEAPSSLGDYSVARPVKSVRNIDLNLPETLLEYDDVAQVPTSLENDFNLIETTTSDAKKSDSELSTTVPSPRGSEDSVPEAVNTITESSGSANIIEKAVKIEGDTHVEKEERDFRNSESLLSEGPGSFRNLNVKIEESGSGAGSLSRLAGLGRAGRRQLAAFLDEFWGQLFDFHGQATSEAKAKKLDLLLGIESKGEQKPATSANMAANPVDLSGYAGSLGGRGPDSLMNSNMYNFSDLSYGVQRGPSLSLSSKTGLFDTYMQNYNANAYDSSERRYSSLRIPSSYGGNDNQPATVHGYQLSYLSELAKQRASDILNGKIEPQPVRAPSLATTQGYKESPAILPGRRPQNGLSSMAPPGFTKPTVSRNISLQYKNTFNDGHSQGLIQNPGDNNVGEKKFYSSPDISKLSLAYRESYLSGRGSQWDNPSSYGAPLYSNTQAKGSPLAFDDLSPSNPYRPQYPSQYGLMSETESLFTKQPFEQFGMGNSNTSVGPGVEPFGPKDSSVHNPETVSVDDLEEDLLGSFRFSITKLLKLDGSEWLFRQNDGADEDIIERVAARERFMNDAETREISQGGYVNESQFSLDKNIVPNCGEDCIWNKDLIVSFGVWCIRRVLELSLMESRPELWGKYTYVLNRLQGVIDLAFSKPRTPKAPCFCLQIPATHMQRSSPVAISNGSLPPPLVKQAKGKTTSAAMLLETIKDVEIAVSCRKGRSGTAAGDVAFPKGKENLASVLKRYKRRLSNK